MTKSTGAKPAHRKKLAAPAGRNDAMKVAAKEGDNVPLATALVILGPAFRHGVTTSRVHDKQFGTMEGNPGYGDYADAYDKICEAAAKGDLAVASELLAAQAMTLDNIFTEMARRMALNMGDYLGATETYARIAMKAQAQSRATLEALTKLHQPREQTVRHVHVNEGGQAVIADQFHHHAGGQENGKAADQSHATGAAGIGPALLGADPFGNGVPIPSREGAEAVPNAWWHESGATGRQ